VLNRAEGHLARAAQALLLLAVLRTAAVSTCGDRYEFGWFTIDVQFELLHVVECDP